MDDPAVASGLVGGETILLLEQRHLRVGPAGQELARNGDTEDPTADDSDPVGHRHLPART
jgi:hypothetical protein